MPCVSVWCAEGRFRLWDQKMVHPLLGPLFGSWCNGMRMPQLKKWCDQLLRLCGVGGRWMNVCALLVEWYRWWKPEVLGNKPNPVLLWPSQTPHGLTWNWTQDSIVKGQRLSVTWLKQRCLYEYDLIQFRYPTCQSSSECHSSDCILSPTYTEHLWLIFVSFNFLRTPTSFRIIQCVQKYVSEIALLKMFPEKHLWCLMQSRLSLL